MILRGSGRRLLLSFRPVAAVRAQPPQVPTTRYYCNNSSLGSFLRHVAKPAAVCRSPARRRLPGRCYTTSQPVDSRARWYHNSLKIASVAALVSGATAIAVCRPYLDLEVVPYTNRTHVVFQSPQSERELWGSRLDEEKKKWAAESRIVDPLHPDSVRVRLIAEKLIRAAHRTLGIDSDDVVMRHGGSSCKDGKSRRTQRRKASPLQPHAGHLREIEWEVILVKSDEVGAMCTAAGQIVVFTGVLDNLKTDAEIAVILGHEVGHTIARHKADIANHDWFPILFWMPFFRMMELEADHIGIMLLGAAGFHPYTTLIVFWKLAKVMQKAMELYKEATHYQDADNK